MLLSPDCTLVSLRLKNINFQSPPLKTDLIGLGLDVGIGTFWSFPGNINVQHELKPTLLREITAFLWPRCQNYPSFCSQLKNKVISVVGISQKNVYAEISYLGAFVSIWRTSVHQSGISESRGQWVGWELWLWVIKIIWGSGQFAHCPPSIFIQSSKTRYYIQAICRKKTYKRRRKTSKRLFSLSLKIIIL